jgi:hypothetical protein
VNRRMRSRAIDGARVPCSESRLQNSSGPLTGKPELRAERQALPQGYPSAFINDVLAATFEGVETPAEKRHSWTPTRWKREPGEAK